MAFDGREGSVLGDYQIVSQLARGTSGVVYEAREQALNRTVALKILAPGPAGDPGYGERLVERARVLARLDHPNIVTVHAVGHCEDLHFVAMEYVSGRPLAHLIQERGALAIQEAVSIARSVAGALAEAHDQGLLHRDINPANILLDSRGHAKLIGFELVGPDQPGARHARGTSGARVSPYLSPEQIEGQELNVLTDVYTLGVVVYEMLSGCPPFQADTAEALIYQILKKPPRTSARGTRPYRPRWLDSWPT